MSELPTWEGFLAPVLGVLRDGSTRSAREVRTAVADLVGLSEDQRAELLNSGKPRFENRIGWALSFLTRAEALERPKRGRYVITGTGQRLLRENPDGLTEENLKAIPAYMAYQPKPRATSAPNGSVPAAESGDESALDPREQMEQGVARVHTEVAGQLLKRLRDGDPEFLEQAVLDVLVAMGYGGVEERARRLGGSGDGGVDGVIDQDPLGLARIYVQAKRYADGQIIGRPAIQGFVGALDGHQASQGVFITTSQFSSEARQYAANVNSNIILIDGERLVGLMIHYSVGVQTVETYTIVEVDEDYFE